MFETVKEKLLNYCEYPEDKITSETEIIKDLQIDSLNLMIIIGDFEEEYGIHFETGDVQDVVTIGDFAKVLQTKIDNK